MRDRDSADLRQKDGQAQNEGEEKGITARKDTADGREPPVQVVNQGDAKRQVGTVATPLLMCAVAPPHLSPFEKLDATPTEVHQPAPGALQAPSCRTMTLSGLVLVKSVALFLPHSPDDHRLSPVRLSSIVSPPVRELKENVPDVILRAGTETVPLPPVLISLALHPKALDPAEPNDTPAVTMEGENGFGGAGGLLDVFWEPVNGARSVSDLANGGGAWVILVDTATIQDGIMFLLLLLSEVYRCLSGHPRIFVPAPLDAEARLADGKISYLKEPPRMSALRDRVQELISGGASFVVLPEDRVVTPHHDLIDRIPKVRLCQVRRTVAAGDAQRRVLRFAFGNLVPEDPSLDQAAAELYNSFFEKLRLRQREATLFRIRSRTESPESDEHYLLKVYTAWLYRNEQPLVEHIEGNRIVDVFVPRGPIYYEIETLYGTVDPVAKMNQTILKYAPPEDLRIVIPNLTALLYLRDLLDLETAQRQQGYNLTLWVVDLSRRGAEKEAGLRRLVDASDKVKRAIQSLE